MCMDPSIEWNEAENFIYADRNPYVGPQAVLEGVFTRLGSVTLIRVNLVVSLSRRASVFTQSKNKGCYSCRQSPKS
jgi:hypothetical protein